MKIFLKCSELKELWHIQTFQLLQYFPIGLQPYLPSGRPFDPPSDWHLSSVLERRKEDEIKIKEFLETDSIELFNKLPTRLQELIIITDEYDKAALDAEQFPVGSPYREIGNSVAEQVMNRVIPEGFTLKESIINKCPARYLLKKAGSEAIKYIENKNNWKFFVEPESNEVLGEIISQIEECLFDAHEVLVQFRTVFDIEELSPENRQRLLELLSDKEKTGHNPKSPQDAGHEKQSQENLLLCQPGTRWEDVDCGHKKKSHRQDQRDRNTVQSCGLEQLKVSPEITLKELAELAHSKPPGNSYDIRTLIDWLRPIPTSYSPGKPGRKKKKK